MALDFKALIGHKDFDALRQEAFTRLRSAGSKITNLNVGGAFRTLLELCMQGLSDLYDLMADVTKQGYLHYATGQWLDLRAEERGLTRIAATKTTGQVVFGRLAPQGAVRVPKGTIVKTDVGVDGEDIRFVTTQDAVLADGIAEIAVAVEAEFAGAAGNVGAGMVKHLATYVAGIDYVRNDADWITSEGADEENDEALRSRCVLRLSELAHGATAKSYESWALANAGVADVAVVDAARGAGTVDVIIASTSGVPSQTLIDTVQAYIDERRPLTADVLVKAPIMVAVDIDATVIAHPDTADLTPIQSRATTLLQALFLRNTATSVEPLGIGDDVRRARVIWLLMTIPGVLSVMVTNPAADVAISSWQMATQGTITVTVQRAAEL